MAVFQVAPIHARDGKCTFPIHDPGSKLSHERPVPSRNPPPWSTEAFVPGSENGRLDAMTIEITLAQQLQRHRERFERYGTIPIAMPPMPTTLVVRSKVGTL